VPASNRRPIITLTTDFGLRDPFVGIVKGVILGICRDAMLVDLTHAVAPQNVLEGALALESAWRFFPAGTIHLAVVDPGVGGARRALGLSTGGHLFVGPDNGLFTFALGAGNWSAVSIESMSYRLSPVSRTFHGRDIFAPAAAHLATGISLERLGPRIEDPVRLTLPAARLEKGQLIGEVIGADHFGNLITSVVQEQVEALGPGGVMRVRLGSTELGTLASRYEDGDSGVPRAIIGSSGRLEIFVRNASANAVLGVPRGTPVTLTSAS
jgi:S-adenosylmethionine hydrolase